MSLLWLTCIVDRTRLRQHHGCRAVHRSMGTAHVFMPRRRMRHLGYWLVDNGRLVRQRWLRHSRLSQSSAIRIRAVPRLALAPTRELDAVISYIATRQQSWTLCLPLTGRFSTRTPPAASHLRRLLPLFLRESSAQDHAQHCGTTKRLAIGICCIHQIQQSAVETIAPGRFMPLVPRRLQPGVGS